jgi:hypothetical protein
MTHHATPLRRLQHSLAVFFGGILLVACHAYGPQGLAPGTSKAQVQVQLGNATASHPPPADQPKAASRLEFARGPMGKHTYMLDFDAQERLLAWEQVLTEARFFKVEPGWSQAQVRAWLGTPSNVRGVGWRGETVWSYRYESPFCVWFEISLINASVVGTGNGPDPLCESKGDRKDD